MEIKIADINYASQLKRLVLEDVRYIVLHHLKSKNAEAEEIHEWHLSNGWAGAGYNEYIRKTGDVYIMRGDNVGAHCRGYNSVSYGIAIEGDFDKEEDIATKQFMAIVDRINYHKKHLKNMEQVLRHKDLNDTECPGRHFDYIYKKLLEKLNNCSPLQVEDAIKILKKNDIITTPEYWLKYAKKGEFCDGEYVGKLIQNIAYKLK